MRIDILIEIGPFRNKQGPFRFLPGPFLPKWSVSVIIVTVFLWWFLNNNIEILWRKAPQPFHADRTFPSPTSSHPPTSTGRSERRPPPNPSCWQGIPNVNSAMSNSESSAWGGFILLCGLGVRGFSIIMRVRHERVLYYYAGLAWKG